MGCNIIKDLRESVTVYGTNDFYLSTLYTASLTHSKGKIGIELLISLTIFFKGHNLRQTFHITPVHSTIYSKSFKCCTLLKNLYPV